MQRVLVVGSPGSGKSMFAKKLSSIMDVPMVSLDALFWRSGWTPSEGADFDRRVTEATNAPHWVMEGNYLSHAGMLRRERADTVVWLDLPRMTCMIDVMIRTATGHGRVRPEMSPGCPERFDADFLHYVWTFRQKQRSQLARFLEGLRSDQILMRFTRRSEADRYLHDLSASESVH